MGAKSVPKRSVRVKKLPVWALHCKSFWSIEMPPIFRLCVPFYRSLNCEQTLNFQALWRFCTTFVQKWHTVCLTPLDWTNAPFLHWKIRRFPRRWAGVMCRFCACKNISPKIAALSVKNSSLSLDFWVYLRAFVTFLLPCAFQAHF